MEKFREFLIKSLRESDRDSQIEQISGALKKAKEIQA